LIGWRRSIEAGSPVRHRPCDSALRIPHSALLVIGVSLRSDPKGDRIVADGRFLWLYTPSTTPGQVLRSRIPEYGSTGPNLIGQFVEHPRDRYTARYVRVDSLPDGVADVVLLVPKAGDQPYSEATIWVSRNDGLVRRLDIIESSGQRRTVILRDIRVNGGVPGRELTFSPPAGVRVVDQ